MDAAVLPGVGAGWIWQIEIVGAALGYGGGAWADDHGCIGHGVAVAAALAHRQGKQAELITNINTTTTTRTTVTSTITPPLKVKDVLLRCRWQYGDIVYFEEKDHSMASVVLEEEGLFVRCFTETGVRRARVRIKHRGRCTATKTHVCRCIII